MTIKYLDSKRISGLSLTYAYNVTTGGGQFNGMASNAPSGGVRARQGVKILSNFSDIGKKVQDITIGIRKNGTVSGTVNVQYINSSYTVLATASMNASELGTGTDDTYDFTLSSEVTIADGDRLLLQYSATAWSNGVVLNGASGTRPTGTDYTYEGTLNSNSFTDGSGSGVPMMTFGGADIKPTNVQDNSIFVETDTARRYWFDETGTTINFPPETTVTEFTTQGTPDDMVFSQDGLHLYTVDGSGALSLGEYTLQTAWDISTASHTRNKSFSYGSLSGVSINNDGTKIYVVDYTTQKCHELDLGTAYNISTAVDNGVFKSIGGSVPTGIHFKPDGTKAYVVDQNPDQLYQYSLSTAWNLSTLNTTAVATKSLSSQNPEGMIMNYAGTKIWVLYNSNDTAEEWTLQTAWDLSTATAGTTWDFSGVANTLSGGDTNPDDSTIYFLNSTGKVLEYPPTPATWTMQPTFEDGLTNYSSTSSSVDLTGSTLSDSWVFRFKLTMTAKSNGIVFMVQDNTSTTVTTPRDGIGLRQTDTTNYYDFEGSNNVGGNAGQYDHRFSSTAPALDTKYIQITRISATQAKIEFYDSTYTTVSETSGDITIANIDNLRYFVVSSNTSTFSIDDVEFYNGVTTIN